MPTQADTAGPLTPSQARALRQQERAAQLEQLALALQATPRGGVQFIPRPQRRCDTAAAVPSAPPVAQRAALQDELLRHLASIDFAAGSAPPQTALVALADYNIVVERPRQPA